MIDNFQNCLAVTLKEEGGYSSDPLDPGGSTMQGITQAVYNVYRRSIGVITQRVRSISESELREIYQLQYWDAVRGDILPKGLDLAVFDYGVNSGPVRAIMALQRVLGVKVDGQFGIITAGALANVRVPMAIISVCYVRLSFLEQLRTWKFFHNGWKARVDRIAAEAQAMAK